MCGCLGTPPPGGPCPFTEDGLKQWQQTLLQTPKTPEVYAALGLIAAALRHPENYCYDHVGLAAVAAIIQRLTPF